MRNLGILLLGFFLLALESPFLAKVGGVHYAPDLVMLIVMYVGLTSSFEAGVALTIGLGLLKDGFALSTPIGMFAEISVIVFLVSFRMSRRLALRGPIALMLIAVFFSLGSSLAQLVLSLVFDRSFGMAASGPETILTAMVPQALVTGPFAPVVFWLFDRLDGLTTRKGDSVYMG